MFVFENSTGTHGSQSAVRSGTGVYGNGSVLENSSVSGNIYVLGKRRSILDNSCDLRNRTDINVLILC